MFLFFFFFFSYFGNVYNNGMNMMTMTMFRVGFESWGTFFSFLFFRVAGYGLVWAVCLDR